MSKMILTVIGGGSVNWMRGLMRDVYLLDKVDGGEIRLVDPNIENVNAVADMLRAFNKMRGKDYKISVVENRAEALSNADFVMTTFSPGEMSAFWNDLELPKKYGICQPVSMTVGPSGISAALRTIPVAYEIVSDMEKYCPDAWLLNVTNPMSTVTRAMNMASKKTKIIGLCHEFHALPSLLGPMLGLYKPDNINVLEYLYDWLPKQGFLYTVAGVNHFIWLTSASLNGEDVTYKIREYCHSHSEIRPVDNGNLQATSSYVNNNSAKLALCRQLGYLPLAGDRHLIEFYPSLCNIRNGYGMKYNVLKTTVDSRKLSKEHYLADINAIARGQKEVKWTRSGEEMTAIMQAIITGKQTVGIMNMPNTGQISNMPNDAVVETLCKVSKEGVTPILSGELPGSVGSLCRLHADVHELTVKAALQGDKRLFVEALSLDPLSGGADFSELCLLADDLLEANKKWLPRFF